MGYDIGQYLNFRIQIISQILCVVQGPSHELKIRSSFSNLSLSCFFQKFLQHLRKLCTHVPSLHNWGMNEFSEDVADLRIGFGE